MASYGCIFNFIKKDLGPLEEKYHRRSFAEGTDEIDLDNIDNVSKNSYLSINDSCLNESESKEEFSEEELSEKEYDEESDQEEDNESDSESESGKNSNENVSSITSKKSLQNHHSINPLKKSNQDTYGIDSDCQSDNLFEFSDGEEDKSDNYISGTYLKCYSNTLRNLSQDTIIDSSDSDNDILAEFSDKEEYDKNIRNNYTSETYCSSGDESEEDILFR